jgi:DNA polymerase-3 subunit epsilon
VTQGRAELFLDTETTGTDPTKHRVWEIGALKRDGLMTSELEVQIITKDLGSADKRALEICQFKNRYNEFEAVSIEEALSELIHFSQDTVLFGLNISFDITFLQFMAEREGLDFHPGWHYSAVDVKSYAAGVLGIDPNRPSHIFAQELGIDQNDYSRHSALGDAYYTADIYDAAKTRGLGQTAQYK